MKQLLWIGLLASATSADTALSEFEYLGEGFCAVTAGCSSTSCRSSFFFRETYDYNQSTTPEDCAEEALAFGARGFSVLNNGFRCYLHPQQDPGLANYSTCPQSGNCPAPSFWGPDWYWYNHGGSSSPILSFYPSSTHPSTCYRRTEPEEVDACLAHPCQNGGTCTDVAGGGSDASGRTCACTGGFTGDSCENETVHGGWTSWGSCSHTCGDYGVRYRSCTNPAPTYGGNYCSGSSSEACNRTNCPVPTENPTENPTEDPTENPTEVCCKEITAECLSCLIGVTEEEFCDASPCTLGCFEKPVCCEARYCQLGLTVEKFFSSPLTPECTPVPTENPSEVPTVNPAEVPTENPTEIPTESPSEVVDPCLEYIHKGACRNQSNCIWSKRDKTCTEG